MSRSIDDLLEPFPHLRVVYKAGIQFGIALAAVQGLGGWWKPADRFRAAVFEEFWAAPLLFVSFYAVTLVYECVIRRQRLGIEQARQNPMEPRRRAKEKDARKQRLRNQRAR